MSENSNGSKVSPDPNNCKTVGGGSIPLIRVVEHAAKLAQADGQRVFVVGGMVRDIFSHGRIGDADLDLVVEGEGIPFAHTLSGAIGGCVKEHPTFYTAKVLPPFCTDTSIGKEDPQSSVAAPLSEVDVASARTEQYVRPGALPEVALTSIERDLFRRDFSINAIAIAVSDFLLFCHNSISLSQLQERVVDPCHGLADLRDKTLRILHPRSFIDDPTRLFRCVRYGVRLGLLVDAGTTEARLDAVRGGALHAISTKRIWNELVACASESLGTQMLRVCGEWGLFDRAPFLGAHFLGECGSVVERLHSRNEVELQQTEVVETLLAATILRCSSREIGEEKLGQESPIHSLQLPRTIQRKAGALAKEGNTGKGSELFESTDLFGTLRWIVTGVS